jgi:hypothetical protein
MRPRLALTLLVLAGLAAPSGAGAKEVTKVTVCGASECRSTTDQLRLDSISDQGVTSDSPARASGWYEVRVTISPAEGEDFDPVDIKTVWVPAANRVRGLGEGDEEVWYQPGPQYESAISKLTAALRPFPVEDLTGLEPRPAPATAPPPAATPPGDGTSPWVWAAIVAAGLGALALVPVLSRAVGGSGRRRRGGTARTNEGHGGG